MGIFGKIKDGISGIVGGIVNGIDKVLGVVGIDFKKLLSNKWVQGALMAASIFTGGVAIVNGIMTGFSQGAAAAAATTTAGGSSMASFTSAFVEGAKGFVSGVAKGMMNPVDTAKEIGGTAMEAMGMGGEIAGASGLEASTGVAIDNASMVNTQSGAADAALSTVEGTPGLDVAGLDAGSTSGMGVNAPNAANPGTLGGGDANIFTPDGFAAGTAPVAPPPGAGAAGAAAKMPGDPGFLQSLAKAGKDFIASPSGIQTAVGAASGWAQGQMIEERWDQLEKKEQNRRDSYKGFGQRSPKLDIPSLRGLRDRTNAMQQRGNQAQAKYGYGGGGA